MNNNYDALEKRIKLKFVNLKLTKNAFIHRSYLNEHKKSNIETNEKLEFLGDSILSMITSIYLYKHYPLLKEGEYTDIKAALVKTDTIGNAALQIGLGEYLMLSKGEEDNNGRTNISILADCFEALVASIYLQFGFAITYKFINRFLLSVNINNIIANKLYLPTKNLLQEYYQNKYKKLPQYKIISEKGPQHKKIYTIGVYDRNQLLGKGVGKSKKQAQENAAKNALSCLKK